MQTPSQGILSKHAKAFVVVFSKRLHLKKTKVSNLLKKYKIQSRDVQQVKKWKQRRKMNLIKKLRHVLGNSRYIKAHSQYLYERVVSGLITVFCICVSNKLCFRINTHGASRLLEETTWQNSILRWVS